jgi:hypothetical protein
MTIEQIRALYLARPFRPFVIHLADGRAIPVMSPEFINRAPSGRTAIVYLPDDMFTIIDLLLVTDLEVRGTPPPADGSTGSTPGVLAPT